MNWPTEFANEPVHFKHRGNSHPVFHIRPLCPSSFIKTRVQKGEPKNKWKAKDESERETQ